MQDTANIEKYLQLVASTTSAVIEIGKVNRIVLLHVLGVLFLLGTEQYQTIPRSEAVRRTSPDTFPQQAYLVLARFERDMQESKQLFVPNINQRACGCLMYSTNKVETSVKLPVTCRRLFLLELLLEGTRRPAAWAVALATIPHLAVVLQFTGAPCWTRSSCCCGGRGPRPRRGPLRSHR